MSWTVPPPAERRDRRTLMHRWGRAAAPCIMMAAVAGCAVTRAHVTDDVAAVEHAPAAVDFCPSDPSAQPKVGAPSTDLYCMELIARPDLSATAGGVAQLAPAPSPFGAAVTQDGHHRFSTTFFIDGLP